MAVFHPGQLDEVLELCRAEGWPTYPADPARALRALTAPGSVTVVERADPAGRVVGFAHGFGDGVTGYLAQLLVAPAHRRHGLGRQLIDEFATRVGSPARIDLLTDRAAGLYATLPHRRYHGFRLHL